MGLLDLTTDLRSLKFGRDRFNGGSSNQPYIQKSIPEELSPTSPDFLLRDGALERGVTDASRLVKFLTDTKSSQGVLFVAKQELLSLQNPIVQGQPNRNGPGKGLYNPLNTILQVGGGEMGLHVEKQGLTSIFNDKLKYFTAVKNLGGPNSENSDANRLVLIYKKKIQDLDPLTSEGSIAFKNYKINDKDPNILFSYAGGASGLGFTNIKIYDRTISKQNLPQGKDLKIYQVGRSPFLGRGGLIAGKFGTNFLGATADYFTYSEINGEAIPDPSDLDFVKFTGINKSGGQIKHYGPWDDNSTLSTDDKSLDLKTYQAVRPSPNLNLKNNLGASISESLTDTEIGINPEGQQINPYGPSDNNSTLTKDHKGKNLETYQAVRPSPILNLKNNLGASISASLTSEELGINPEGQQTKYYGPSDDNSTLTKNNKGLNLEKYQVGKEGSITDRSDIPDLPTPPSYRTYKITDPVTTSAVSNTPQNEVEGKQIIKFFFEILNNDAAGSSEFLYFRAYIDTLSDNFSADWGNVKYTGRAENFYQYKGFNRDISLGFSILAQREEELPSIYEKLNTLAGVCAPDYSNVGYMRGNMIRLTVGDYIKSLPCVMKGFNIEGLIGNGNWGLESGKQTPRYLKIGGMNILPIHNFIPERGAEFFNVPQIA